MVEKLRPLISDVASSYTIPASALWKENYSNINSNHAYYDNATDGAYYNWHTATAGSGTSSISSGNSAQYSICPKGWRLPTGGSSSGDFKALMTAYNIGSTYAGVTTLKNSPFNFIIAGYISYGNGLLDDRNNEGDYWSSTAGTRVGSACSLSLRSSGVLLADDDDGVFGYTVRCVAR